MYFYVQTTKLRVIFNYAYKMISFFDEDTNYVLKQKLLIKKWLRRVAYELGKTASFYINDINYIFCSDEYLLAINKQYLGHDYYTDIITFDESSPEEIAKNQISADIFISIDTVRHNAEEYGEGFDRELKRVIVHGVLHLIGYDDVDDVLRSEMRSAENKALELLNNM